MDLFRYFDISLRHHLLCNPSSVEKLDGIIGLLPLSAAGRVLDIACGKGEFLIRTVERKNCAGVGVDLSPYAIEHAKTLIAVRIPGADVTLHQVDGGQYEAPAQSFELVSCLGASWVWAGYTGTLEALTRWTKRRGYVLVGEPFWRKQPDPEYLEASGFDANIFFDHRGNVDAAIAQGLTPLYTAVSNQDEWDHYETLQWYAVEEWAGENPNDPDYEEIVANAVKHRDSYLRWGRDTLGWSLYLFRV